MVVSLVGRLRGDPRLLEQVVLDDAALDLELLVEAHLHEAPETGRVVVPYRLGVACNGCSKWDIIQSYVVVKFQYFHPLSLSFSP